jgi:hypothetical protein
MRNARRILVKKWRGRKRNACRILVESRTGINPWER